MRVGFFFAIALCVWTGSVAQQLSPGAAADDAQRQPETSPTNKSTSKQALPVNGETLNKKAGPNIPLPAGVELPSIRRRCSPESPRIGTQISCIVDVRHAKDFSISIPVPNGFDAESQTVSNDSEALTMLVTARQVFTTPLSMRKLKLFGFTASWTHESGAKGTLVLEDEYMAMSSMMAQVDEPEFRTFRAPVPDFDTFWSAHGVLPLIGTNWGLIIALTVLVLGSFFAMIVLYIQRVRARRRLADVPWVDPRPAHVIANEALERLAAENLPEKGETLAFYLRLSDILRVFLENRFGIAIKRGLDESGRETGLRFTAATTEEIESVLMNHAALTEEGFKTLMECFGIIDYVVFGGIRPHVGQTEADRRQIRFCIDLNKAPEMSTASNTTNELLTEPDESMLEEVTGSIDRERHGSLDVKTMSNGAEQMNASTQGEEL